VFSLMSGSVIEHLEDRPELFYQFEEVIRELFQPWADQETVLNVQGKGDVIGDNTTLHLKMLMRDGFPKDSLDYLLITQN